MTGVNHANYQPDIFGDVEDLQVAEQMAVQPNASCEMTHLTSEEYLNLADLAHSLVLASGRHAEWARAETLRPDPLYPTSGRNASAYNLNPRMGMFFGY